jgi:MYXO-CTERM domain-containing protein
MGCSLLVLAGVVIAPTGSADACPTTDATVSWAVDERTVLEDAGTVPVVLQRSFTGPTACTTDVTISWQVGKHTGSSTEATHLEDFDCPDAATQCGLRTFANNAQQLIVNVDILNEVVTTPESIEGIQFFHLIVVVVNGAAVVPPASDYVDIGIEDEAGVFFFSDGDPIVTDEDVGSTPIRIARTGEAEGQVKLKWYSDGTCGTPATDGTDFDAGEATLTFEDLDLQHSFLLAIEDDGLREETEHICLDLVDFDTWAGTTLGRGPAFGEGLSLSRLRIRDNDPDGPTSTSTSASSSTTTTPIPGTAQIQFSTSAYSAGEDADTVTINVVRTGSTSGVAEVRWAATLGSATGDDFTAQNGVAVFSSGQVTRELTFAIPDDDVVDGAKTVLLSLSDAVGAVLGAPATATLTIVDDDTVTQTTTPSNDTPVAWLVGLLALVAVAARRRH